MSVSVDRILHQINDGGEVVAVAIEKHSARIGAQRIALAVAILGLEELAVKHLALEVAQMLAVLAQEIVGYDNLVEQIPSTHIF